MNKRNEIMEAYLGLLLFAFTVGAICSALAFFWMLKRHLHIDPFSIVIFVSCVCLIVLTSQKFHAIDASNRAELGAMR